MVIRVTSNGTTKVQKITSTGTSTVKTVVVGTPVRRVASGAFSLENLIGVDTSAGDGNVNGAVLVYNATTSKYEPKKELDETNITGGQF